jgi:anti-sigma B factor antagonist
MSKMNLTASVRKANSAVSIIDIKGEINAQSESVLMEAYNQASLSGIRSIILNFSGLEYMNSSGIGLLVTLLIRVRRQNQRLLAFGLTDHYQQIFEMTRLNEAIGLYSSEKEAVSAVIKEGSLS